MTGFTTTDICPGGYTSQCDISTTYGTVAGQVTENNGLIASLGSATPPTGDFRLFGSSVVGEPSGDGNLAYIDANQANGTAGVFDFTPVGSHLVSINSLLLGLSNSAGSSPVTETVDFYNNANTLLGSSTFVLTGGNFTTITPGAFATDQTSLKVEFGQTGGTSVPDNYFTIDQLSYTVSAVPEPGTVALFGMGFVGIGPLLLRRRRRRT